MAAAFPKSNFLKAALQGDVSTLKRLAQKYGDDNMDLSKVVQADGSNALHVAAASGKRLICKHLLGHLKFNIDAKDCKGNTPLMAAIEHRQHETAVYLMEKGADVGLPNIGGFSPLHSAARLGQIEIMRQLLSRGAPNLNTGNFYTPLQCACIGPVKGLGGADKNKEAVKFLLDHGADPNANANGELYESALMICIATESLECMELLLKAGADPNLRSTGRTALIYAAIKGDTMIIKRLLRAGANPDVVESSKLMTPLEMAAFFKKVDAVKILFPVTSRIPTIPDWSVDGLLKLERPYTREGLQQMVKKNADSIETLKAKGRDAFERKDYLEAMGWYSEALKACLMNMDVVPNRRLEDIGWYTEAEKVCPVIMDVVSNRSLCFAKLNYGKAALEDAEICVGVKPEWAKGHYRLGAARMLLHEYPKAVKAFAKAMELDPKNQDIKKAHREAVEAELAARMSGSRVS